MLRIVTLLNQKNHYLEKFYTANETELLNFAQGNFDSLEQFYQDREKLLEIIRYIDQQIEQEPVNAAEISAEQKREISTSLAVKDEYVTRILAQDLEILTCIESAKSSIIRELREIKRTKKAVGGYKSKTFTNRLDEEA